MDVINNRHAILYIHGIIYNYKQLQQRVCASRKVEIITIKYYEIEEL